MNSVESSDEQIGDIDKQNLSFGSKGSDNNNDINI